MSNPVFRSKPTKASEVIEDALTLFDKDGKKWIKGAYKTVEGACCMMGAIESVTGESNRSTDDMHGLSGRARKYLQELIGRYSAKGRIKYKPMSAFGTASKAAVESFNDNKQTTFEDVRQVMLDAAYEARANGD